MIPFGPAGRGTEDLLVPWETVGDLDLLVAHGQEGGVSLGGGHSPADKAENINCGEYKKNIFDM